MSTTDSAAEVAFDSNRPFRTRDGRLVLDFRQSSFERGRGWTGYVVGEDRERTWWPNGRSLFGPKSPNDLVNIDPDPVEPAGDPVRDGGAAKRSWSPPAAETDAELLEHMATMPGSNQVLAAFVKGKRFARVLDLAREALAARVTAAPQPEPGAGEDDAAFVEGVIEGNDDGWLYREFKDDVALRLASILRRGARAPVAGGEPVARDGVEVVRYTFGVSYRSKIASLSSYQSESSSFQKVVGDVLHEIGAHPPAPPAPTAERGEPLALRDEDLRIETYRRAGKPALVNETDPCVRVVHLPTGLCTCSEDGASQRFNRAAAIAKLTRLVAAAIGHPNPPHGHQAPPAVPVGGVSAAVAEALQKSVYRSIHRWITGEQAIAALEAALAARPTPDDGCPKGDPECLGGNGDCLDACSTFKERGAVEEAVAAEREACAKVARSQAAFYGSMHTKTDDPAQYLIAEACDAVSVAIRSRASTPAGHDKTEA